jgi:hypothetical protein
VSEQPDLVYGTAVYRSSHPGEIVITRDGDVFGEPYQGPAEAPPKRHHLAPTPWKNVPGQEWAQDETGAWHISVYQDDVTLDRPS